MENLDYLANVVNKLSHKFFKKHGVDSIQAGAFESNDLIGKVVMTCRYCIRHQLKQCLKNKKSIQDELYLIYDKYKFQLEFDCDKCEMNLRYMGRFYKD
jgi:putative protease